MIFYSGCFIVPILECVNPRMGIRCFQWLCIFLFHPNRFAIVTCKHDIWVDTWWNLIHLPTMSYEKADRVFTKSVITRTSFNRFNVATLRRVCQGRQINVKSTRIGGRDPTKADYILALFTQVCSSQNNDLTVDHVFFLREIQCQPKEWIPVSSPDPPSHPVWFQWMWTRTWLPG